MRLEEEKAGGGRRGSRGEGLGPDLSILPDKFEHSTHAPFVAGPPRHPTTHTLRYKTPTASTAMILRSTTATFKVLLAFSLLWTLAQAHRVDLPASKKECFFEDLHVNDKVRLLCRS